MGSDWGSRSVTSNLEVAICDLNLSNETKYLYDTPSVPIDDGLIISKIYVFRDEKVMLDEDLAELYEVETRRLNEQVRHNEARFYGDFMFQLTEEELEILRSQNATSSWGKRRKLPLAFTEHGVLMLSSVLRSDKSVAVNIQIMRVFTRMRELLMSHKDLILKVEQMEQEMRAQGSGIATIYQYVKELIEQPRSEPRRAIGYKRTDERDG